MKRLGKSVGLAVCAAQIVGGCLTSPVDPQPGSPAVPMTTVQDGDSWANGARPLRKVTVRVTVSGDKDRVLSSNGQGFVVIHEEMPSANDPETAPVAKLVYQNGRPGIYELPGGVYTVTNIADKYWCQPASFHVPASEGEHPDIVVFMDISVTGSKATMTMVRSGAIAAGATTSDSYATAGLPPAPYPPIANEKFSCFIGSSENNITTALKYVGLIFLFPIFGILSAPPP